MEIETLKGENQDLSANDDLYNITSWGADMTLMDIIMSYQNNDIIKPELQRKYVWDRKEASRFIESILLGLPVPSIFLANTLDYSKLIVDGYQRIMTIVDFYNGIWSGDGRPFNLYNSEVINKRWRNKTYKELSAEDQRRYRMYTIHAIIFEQKQPRNDSGLYQIFERINTSGKSLNPQEIRNCVYQGNLNTLLFELNKYESWRTLFGDNKEDSRMRDIEFILRFFALSESSIIFSEAKNITLKKELNDYMSAHVERDEFFFNQKKQTFIQCVDFIMDKIGNEAFYNLKNDLSSVRKKFYPTIFDSLMIATKIALERGYSDDALLAERRLELLRDQEYRDSITQGTMQTEHIRTRISKALQVIYQMELADE